jgi:CRISPR-associated exonuclease Cas4
MDEYLLPISALSHYRYCQRRCALVHVEQVWAENRFTQEGNILHERVDSGLPEQRRNIRYERSVLLLSQRYRLTGKMDLLEIEVSENEGQHRYFPVEYKRGKPKVEDWDRVQLCAQALCIEEMRDTRVAEGAIWHWEVRRRESVAIDDALRQVTIDAIEHAHVLIASGITPPPTKEKQRCRACSLVDMCNPYTFRQDRTSSYIENMYAESDTNGEDASG